MNYISRSLEDFIMEASDTFGVVAITGPRQVGKTTLLKHLAQTEQTRGKQRAYVSLDDTTQRLLAKEDPAMFLQRFAPPVLIDEIQYAPELLPYIKTAVDESGEKGLFWITGSQPFHLMKNISESLAGRVAIVELMGLSQSEIAGVSNEPYTPSQDYYLRRVNLAHKMAAPELFERILQGSFPGIAGLPKNQHREAYESLLSTYLMRDIRDLAQVADEMKFRRFLTGCAALTAKPVNYAELARIADIDAKTAKAWLSLLVSSYLVKIVQPYSNNLIKRLNKQPVLHFVDTGLAAYLTGWETAESLERGAFAGQIFETYVFGELYKSFINAGRRPPLYYFRTNDKKEIDLLMEENGALYPIEIKKSASPEKKDAKNFSALDPVAEKDVPDELAMFKRKVGTGAIVCMTETALPVREGVWSFPAWAI